MPDVKVPKRASFNFRLLSSAFFEALVQWNELSTKKSLTEQEQRALGWVQHFFFVQGLEPSPKTIPAAQKDVVIRSLRRLIDMRVEVQAALRRGVDEPVLFNKLDRALKDPKGEGYSGLLYLKEAFGSGGRQIEFSYTVPETAGRGKVGKPPTSLEQCNRFRDAVDVMVDMLKAEKASAMAKNPNGIYSNAGLLVPKEARGKAFEDYAREDEQTAEGRPSNIYESFNVPLNGGALPDQAYGAAPAPKEMYASFPPAESASGATNSGATNSGE